MDGRTGIWHETFLVRAGECEAVCGNMPAKGLGKASELMPPAGSSSARSRIKSALVEATKDLQPTMYSLLATA